MRTRTRALALTSALALSLAACGGGDTATDDGASDAGSSEAGVVEFVGNDQLQWEETSKTAELVDGELTMTITCDGTAAHNVILEGVDGDGIIAECEGGAEGTGTVSVEPGTYTYYCNVAGHREAGMEGELTVTG